MVPDKESESRLDFQRAGRFLTAAQAVGEPLHLDRLEGGMLLLNDLPGVAAESALRAGTQEGLVEQVVKLTDTPFVTGRINIDNFGIRSSGEYRTGAVIDLNNPGGIGDLVSVRVLGGFDDRITNRLGYGRISYVRPVGYRGLRLGAALAAMDYDLGADLKHLDAQGKSTLYSLFAAYPVIRHRQHNLSISASYDHKQLHNKSLGATISDKKVDVLTIGLSGDRSDRFIGGGWTSLAADLVIGKLDLSGWQEDLDQDRAAARTHGEYKKALFSFFRIQRLAEKTSLSLRVTHQHAFENLDSSEDFSLGGAFGVRAYPASEAVGDQGTLVAVELTQRLTPRLNIFGFYDYGRIRVNHSEWTATNTPNSYSLEGIGVGIAYIKPDDFLLRVTVADRLGSNPAKTAAGKDSDGTKRSPRIWLEMRKSF